jgi:hypothetical protein
MNLRTEKARVWLMLAAATATFFASAASMRGQVQTATNTTKQASTQEVTVERAEVVRVSGNDLIVKMEDGTIRHFPKVSESARITVDGKQVGVHELKAGMKLQRTITVTRTPTVVTTTQQVTGKVWHVNAPNSVILTLEDGTNRKFDIPQDQKFNVDGQMTDAWGLKKGMKISATKVVEEPVDVYEHEQLVAGTTPTPPPLPPADQPILLAVVVPPSAPAPVSAPAPKMPKTGSFLPLISLLGVCSILSSFGLKVIRNTF